ncbi:SPFH domain-containing protein [Anaerobaca lacustris]|uniref:SPFH domain-containing protein n=1 Tax=Anaerobaca lacustris TaxID=3044600 RepID=A0AAW6TQJ5_9BACT|nr:SPFH domain-containing protein [Sedimentisphaerales bacterium M17dextr]
MTTSSKRPEHVAWVSLVLSLIFFGIAFFLGRWSGFFSVSAVAWQILGAALIWLVLAIQFHQRSLAEQERLDMTQLAQDKSGSSLFEGKGERATLLAAAQRRLDLLEKWFLPIFSALIAVYEIALGLYLLRGLTPAVSVPTQQPLVCAILLTVVAFVSFLLSRYATGMSAELAWKPLRAGGSFLLGVAVVCFALALSLAGTHFQFRMPLLVMGYVVPILLIVLGAETALNTVLDIYRPRLKGQYSRSAFDSRLLGIINEPGGVFRSLAAAIDYQFGFQVSQTWFYKLLEKAVVPLVLFSIATLYLASCIVVVLPNEEVIVERFGSPTAGNGQVRHLVPGIHFKLPWPIDTAYKHPTKQIMELYVGYVPHRDPKTGRPMAEPALLWGQTHYESEFSFLVASEQGTETLAEGAVPVSLVKANMPIQYRIKDLYTYIYGHRDPAALLEAICYRELTEFAASAEIEVDMVTTGQVDNESLLGAGRTRAKEILTERIQEAADEQGLGIELVFLGVQGIHPPPEVAPDYQAVIGAVQRKHALVLNAEAERNATLGELIGSVEKAYELADLATAYQSAQTEGRTDDAERLGEQFDEALAQAKGEVFKILREAQSYAFERATLAEATGERFAGQIKAFKAAPRIFKEEQRLAVFDEALPGIRKYVVAVDPNDSQVVIVDLQDRLPTSLLDIGGIEETIR